MKKLLLVYILFWGIINSSCSRKTTPIVYHEDQPYQIKDVINFAHLENNDLKASGFKLIGDNSQPPFSPDDPNVDSILPISDTGHISSSPFYIHTKQGICWWAPIRGDAGIYYIKFTASDGKLSDEEIVKITVLESTNKPPVLFVKFEANSSLNSRSFITTKDYK